MRVSAMVDGELMGFEGDAAKVIKARDDEIGVLRHVIEALEVDGPLPFDADVMAAIMETGV